MRPKSISVHPRIRSPRLVDKNRFVDRFFGHEKSFNRVRQGSQENN